MTFLPPLSQIEAAVAGLFPTEVFVAVERVGQGGEVVLWPAEWESMADAGSARRAEFAAGRAAARRCIGAMGLPTVAVPVGPDRAPIWPHGIYGSISHAMGLAVAVTAVTGPLGIDIAEDAPIQPDLWPIICSDVELPVEPSPESGRRVLRIFSAKEAVFKAQAPMQRAFFGFDAVVVDVRGGEFVARFQMDVAAFRAGHQVWGRLANLPGLVIAGVGP